MCSVDWSAIANWMTAVATAALAVLTLLTLRKIAQYVVDTQRLVQVGQDQLRMGLEELALAREQTELTRKQIQVSLDQVEASSRPIIVVFTDGTALYFKNLGTGPAFNIEWQCYEPSGRVTDVMTSFREVEPNDDAWILMGFAQDVFRGLGDSPQREMTLSYKSTSGRHYLTIAQLRHKDSVPLISLAFEEVM